MSARFFPLPRRWWPALLLLVVGVAASAASADWIAGVPPASSSAIASATTRYVAPGGTDGANLCLDPAAPCLTLGRAVAVSAPDDTLRLAAGVYSAAEVRLPHSLTLLGDGAATTTLDGGGAGPILHVPGGVTVSVDGLTMRNGLAQRGGALRVESGGDLTLRRAAVLGNRADLGGAVYVAGGTLTAEDSRLADNSAAAGGAIYVETGTVTISRSEIAGNDAGAGGGLALGSGATADLRRVTLRDNSARTVGGAITSAGGLTLRDALLIGNRAAIRGGGLFNDTGAATIDYTTWIGNAAPVGAAVAGTSPTRLAYSVISGGDGPACDGPLTSGGLNRAPDATCGGPAQPPTGLLPDGRPQQGSNAIDAGPPGTCGAADDLRGRPRPADGDRDGSARCDLGAYEFQPSLTIVHTPDDDTQFTFSGDLGAFALDRAQPRHIVEIAPGSYRVTQERETGWKLTALVCEGDGDGGTTADVGGRTATVDLDPDESIVCAFTSRPNRESVGVALRLGGGATGDPTVSFGGGLGAFELRATQPDYRSGRLAPGVYALTAAAPPGWRVAGVACLGDRDGGTTIDLTAATALIDLDSREAIGCTFTLAPLAATLTIRHSVQPTEDMAASYTGDLGLFTLRALSAPARTFALPPGAYAIHELLHPQWTLSSLHCAGDADGGSLWLAESNSAVIDLDAGETLDCAFGHVRAAAGAGAITIVQAADPAEGAIFAYDGDLGGFSLSAPGAAARTWGGLRPGRYAVRQIAPAGWLPAEVSCAGDGDGGTLIDITTTTAAIDLDEGETITCTFRNARPSTTGAITIQHEASPADDLSFRYLGTLGGFTLRAPSRPGRAFADLPPGVYTVYARPVDGWATVELSCSGDTDGGTVVDIMAATAVIDLDAGEAIVCRFRHIGPGAPTPTPSPTPPAPPPTPTPPPPGETRLLFLPIVAR